MAIPEGHHHNFATLIAAAKADRLALLEVKHAANGTVHVAIVALNVAADGDGVDFVPLALCFDGNPYEDYLPPDPERKDGFLLPEGSAAIDVDADVPQ